MLLRKPLHHHDSNERGTATQHYFESQIATITDVQPDVFDSIVQNVDDNNGRFYFIDAPMWGRCSIHTS